MRNNSKTKIVILFFILIYSSCTNKSSKENNDSLIVNTDSTNSVGKNIDELDSKKILSNILNTKSNIERATIVGKKLDLLSSLETAVLADSASNYKGYTQYFNESDEEFVDIQYFNNGDLVTAVNFDIYLNKQEVVGKLYNELLVHFNAKYGKAVLKENENTWALPNNQTLFLKDVSQKLAPGLQIQFAIKNTNTTIE